MIRGVVIGIITILLLALNAAFWGTCIVLLGIVKLAIHVTAPRSRARTRVILMLAWMATRWVAGNNQIFDLMLPTRWEIDGIGDDVRMDGHYLIVSNHLSWVDIFALYRAFHGRAAFIRFFLKRQLFWSPVVGQACWALEFPFMHRYTPEYLEKHPEKRGTDLMTTRKACQRYRNFPVAMMNFLEGTRFSKAKHDQQRSPYRHLLAPRIGGISFVLAALGDQLDAMYDVTLAYPPANEITIGQFVCGHIPKVIIHARRLDPPPQFFDQSVTHPGPEREQLKLWIETMWKEKDALLSELLR
ncbi:MAG TPA: acyltransferase [Thermoanaerobaculia bacterium]|nr:acyltransferase [Thermoanaerobaculia bacterium]